MRELKSYRATVATAVIVLLVGGWVLTSARPGRETAWRGCLGKQLEECQIPQGFTKPQAPFPDYCECRTTPPGTRYAASTDTAASSTLWASTAYAVIALDGRGRVVAVEMKRRYGAF